MKEQLTSHFPQENYSILSHGDVNSKNTLNGVDFSTFLGNRNRISQLHEINSIFPFLSGLIDRKVNSASGKVFHRIILLLVGFLMM